MLFDLCDTILLVRTASDLPAGRQGFTWKAKPIRLCGLVALNGRAHRAIARSNEV